jgi:hypothetical protein
MPSFAGQPLGSASRSLQDAGFRLGNVSVVAPVSTPAPDAANLAAPAALPSPPSPQAQAPPPAQASPASIIVSQVPAAGQKGMAGAVVNFDVR